MGQWLEVLAGGITQGAIYCVFAFGLSLVYGTTRIMNFAHGSFYMVGGYLAWVLSVGYFGFSYPIVFLIVVPLLFLLGVAVGASSFGLCAGRRTGRPQPFLS